MSKITPSPNSHPKNALKNLHAQKPDTNCHTFTQQQRKDERMTVTATEVAIKKDGRRDDAMRNGGALIPRPRGQLRKKRENQHTSEMKI
jgi:hypothetical protein